MILPPIRTLAGRMRPAKLNRPDADRTSRPRGGGELLLAGCVVSNRRTRARAGETRRRAPQPGAAQRRTRARAGETKPSSGYTASPTAAPALARGRQARWSTRPACWAAAPALARGRRTDWLGSLDNAMPPPQRGGGPIYRQTLMFPPPHRFVRWCVAPHPLRSRGGGQRRQQVSVLIDSHPRAHAEGAKYLRLPPCV